ncbi:RNA helicase [Paenibacillus illinoisensis]|uniref:RNA helicase n=1 Tax=Paenibacillus illinoisensis TaxID=59845 RepID=UPI000FD777D3|nr:RNA helicase [Paenibacillus illinoisensis]
MTEETKFLNIGLVMPIAPIDGCSTDHWLDVKRIITEAVSSMPGYSSNPKIVSEGDSSGLIHKRIVEGLYTSDIIICDVSCKNPNVMFELGMRLAFDKPTIIIKDDKTDYTFDAGVIEHLQYPRDLRYKSVVEFKELLSEKVRATHEESIQDGNKSSFLKSFGTIKVASIQEDEVPVNEFFIQTLKEIQNDISVIKSSQRSDYPKNQRPDWASLTRLNKIIFKSMEKYSNQKNLKIHEMATVESLEDLIDYVTNDLEATGFGPVTRSKIRSGIYTYFDFMLKSSTP